MPSIQGWKRIKSTYPQWKNERTGKTIWVYPHKTWEIDPRTGNVKKGSHKTTHYTIRHFIGGTTRTAKALNGKEFKTQASATKYAIAWMRKRPRG